MMPYKEFIQCPKEFYSRELAEEWALKFEKYNTYGDAFWVEPRGAQFVIWQGTQSDYDAHIAAR